MIDAAGGRASTAGTTCAPCSSASAAEGARFRPLDPCRKGDHQQVTDTNHAQDSERKHDQQERRRLCACLVRARPTGCCSGPCGLAPGMPLVALGVKSRRGCLGVATPLIRSKVRAGADRARAVTALIGEQEGQRYTVGHGALSNWRRPLGGGHKQATPREPSSAVQVRATVLPDRDGRRRQFCRGGPLVDMFATGRPETRSRVTDRGSASVT